MTTHYNYTDCMNGEIRLTGLREEYANENTTAGRVEVCNFNKWGTVCDDRWGQEDARVVCRQLGHVAEGAEVLSDVRFTNGAGEVWFQDFMCTGNESHLVNCTRANAMCLHGEDAGVECRIRATSKLPAIVNFIKLQF